MFFDWVKGILVSSLLEISFHYLFHLISIHLAQRCSAQKIKTCSIPNNVIYVCTYVRRRHLTAFSWPGRCSWRIWFTVPAAKQLPNFQSTVYQHEIVEFVYPCSGYMHFGQWLATHLMIFLTVLRIFTRILNQHQQGSLSDRNAK